MQGAAEFDSLAQTVSAGATAEHFVPLHMYAVASIFVLFTHIRVAVFRMQQGKDFFYAQQLIGLKGARESNLHAS